MYKTGGLEPVDNKTLIMNIGGNNYVITEKLRDLLRENLIDWGTFNEINCKECNDNMLIKQVVSLLSLKPVKTLDDLLIVLEKTYNSDDNTILDDMMKQFLIYEPISLVLVNVFNVIKKHYESLIELFVDTRNKYIDKHHLKDIKNDWNYLKTLWDETNKNNSLSSSSVILLSLSDSRFKQLETHVDGNDKMPSSIREFKYPGICPRVPHDRLYTLLTFPLDDVLDAIKDFDTGETLEFKNYDSIEEKVSELLRKKENIIKPIIENKCERPAAPSSLEKNKLVHFYVDAILELRNKLIDSGEKLQTYYIDVAKALNEVSDYITGAIE